MLIETVPFTHPDVETLTEAAQRFYRERYGDPDESPIDAAEFAAPKGTFLLARLDGEPVACGGWRSGVHGDPGDVEIKRMFVLAEHRGKGLARMLIAELERTAALAGFTRVILETGTEQPEAMAFYVSTGYHPIPSFGYYREAPESRCYAKQLTSN
ncbi:GNAT family N-acetyltransferase [Sciscionella sediminilitoris]|uniref:GNAT family N-acetyltransferase n=1 Tax=Sciscionella sediminilitoris TaxID=1445613 RepID=UPI0004DF88DE|nr:GNAT family N-acetyltransferase [Sciscionella sp. SE31]